MAEARSVLSLATHANENASAALAKCVVAEEAALRGLGGTSELARRIGAAGDADRSGASKRPRLSDNSSLAGEAGTSSGGIETDLR